MTPEELDEARAKEALREADEANRYFTFLEVATLAARRAREGWTPPKPVDPDVLAFREWALVRSDDRKFRDRAAVVAGKLDYASEADAYLAGARMAREQEQERAKEAVDFVRRFVAVNAPQFLVPPTVQKRLNNNAPYIGTPTQFRLEDWVMHPSPSPSVVEARDILAKYNGEA
jgi:hypothetical protein